MKTQTQGLLAFFSFLFCLGLTPPMNLKAK